MRHVRVYDVTKVTTTLLKKLPPDLLICATGRVPTSGWKNPELSAWLYITPPADYIQDFDFIAEKPSGFVLQAFFDINAEAVIRDVDLANYWGPGKPLKGVRVHAATGAPAEEIFGKAIAEGKGYEAP